LFYISALDIDTLSRCSWSFVFISTIKFL